MEIWAKRFTKMALIYLALGVVMGVVIGTQPDFVHIHLNLLGFMTMFIAGVAYHVLPRFNSRPVPWPGGVKYHFLLHNTGLLGMASTHLAGGLWSGGILHAAFVGFALMTGAGLLIMAYNLYFILVPTKEEKDAEG
jgi:cbb3-type cytochrome oxidase subunit 1